MTISELRKIVKSILIAQDGKFYNFNSNNICSTYGISCIDVQNACSYFRYSPQQKAFRERYNIQ